ncbi:uncharacterized protein ISCGN_031674 [Ixodes scapularis]
MTGECKRHVQHLALIGGNDEKDTTRRILCALVKHDLALRLSWCGSGGKKEAFGDLQNLRTVVLHAVRSTCSMATKTSVETTMKSWLVAAPDRNGGRSKRRAADQQPTSATRQPLHGALPMALYQPNDRHGATLDHCCSADGTIPAQRSALCRPWPLVFCRCHYIISVADPKLPRPLAFCPCHDLGCHDCRSVVVPKLPSATGVLLVPPYHLGGRPEAASATGVLLVPLYHLGGRPKVAAGVLPVPRSRVGGRPKAASATGVLQVPRSQVGGCPKAALGHWCSVGALISSRWPTQSCPGHMVFCWCHYIISVADPKLPRPLVFCRCHDFISVADPKPPLATGVLQAPRSQLPRPLVFCWCHYIISVADLKPASVTGVLPVPGSQVGGRPSCCPRPLVFCRCQDPRSVADPKPPLPTGVLPVPGSQVGGRPKAALAHWCSAGARIPGRWPIQSRPRPLVFCRCQDPRSVADPKPPSATGVLPVPRYHLGGRPKAAIGHWGPAGARISGRWPTQSRPRPLVFCRCQDPRSVADPKPPSATGVLPVPRYHLGGRPKAAIGHWGPAGARISGRWPTQIRPRPLVFCQCHDIISVADPNPPSATGVLPVPSISSRWPTQNRPRPLVFCQCHRYHLGGRPKSALGHWCFASAIDIISVADPNPPSATGVLPVPRYHLGGRPKTALGHWCFASAIDIISVADPNPPSATGVLPVPRFQVGGRPKSAFGHWCSANATMPARWPTQYRPWPLVFCRCPAIGAQPMPEPGVLGHGARPSQSPGRWAFLMPRDHNEVGTDLFGRAMADEKWLGHGDMAILRPSSPCYLGTGPS